MLSAHIKTICGPSLTMKGQENSPAKPAGGVDDGSMTSQEKQTWSSPLTHIFFYHQATD